MNEVASYGELRSAVIYSLLRPRILGEAPHSVDTIQEDLGNIARQRGWIHHTGAQSVSALVPARGDRNILQDAYKARIWDLVWDMIIEGLIRPGTAEQGSGTVSSLHLTEFGKKALKDPTTPYDPDGYIRRLTEGIPAIDRVIVTYITESVETLRRHCLLSSTMTLGCASEKAILLMFNAYADALNPADKMKFQKAIEKLRGIKQQHEEFMKWYERNLKEKLKADKGNDWVAQLENALQLVFHHYRHVRNDAGHPTGNVLSREEVHEHLVVFPRYLERLYELMTWLAANKPL
jgi:hypothetical protein